MAVQSSPSYGIFFGGVGQFAAAMWAYRARDAVAAAFNGSWAAFWLGTSIMYLLVPTGAVFVPARDAMFAPLGMWFMYMAAVSFTTSLAALARSPGGFAAQAVVGVASVLAAIGLLSGSSGWDTAAGWAFVAAAALSFYIGAATMLDNVYGIIALPLLTWRRGENTVGTSTGEPIQFADNDPGVKVGQQPR